MAPSWYCYHMFVITNWLVWYGWFLNKSLGCHYLLSYVLLKFYLIYLKSGKGYGGHQQRILYWDCCCEIHHCDPTWARRPLIALRPPCLGATSRAWPRAWTILRSPSVVNERQHARSLACINWCDIKAHEGVMIHFAQTSSPTCAGCGCRAHNCQDSRIPEQTHCMTCNRYKSHFERHWID